MTPTRVYLEVGAKRVFAVALDWPGWCRSGRDEPQALEALAAYAERYGRVVAAAGHPLPAGAGEGFEVLERVRGDGTTDFGAPSQALESDRSGLAPAQRARQRDLVAACWAAIDAAAAKAPAELRKGPRGGGRDRDQVLDHVLGAEAAYARKIGSQARQPDAADAQAVASFRAEVLEALDAASEPGAETRWPGSYAARRIAWHVLDHAWEIEDKGS